LELLKVVWIVTAFPAILMFGSPFSNLVARFLKCAFDAIMPGMKNDIY